MVIPVGSSGAAYQLSTSALKERRQRAKYSLEKQISQKEAAKVGMKKMWDLDLLDAAERQAQREADKCSMRKKREPGLLDTAEHQAQG